MELRRARQSSSFLQSCAVLIPTVPIIHWCAKHRQAWDGQLRKNEDDRLQKLRNAEKAAITQRAVQRHTTNYSKWDTFVDDTERSIIAAADGSDGKLACGDPTTVLHKVSKLAPFIRKDSELLLWTLSGGLSGGESKKRVDTSSAMYSAFGGLSSLLSNLGVLNLPQRRLEQLLEPSALPPWCRAVEEMGIAGQKNVLVAGLGVGATLITAARTAQHATYVGFDTLQPSLARVLRETLLINSVKIEASKRGGGPTKAFAGLSALRKPESASGRPTRDEESPRVYLQRGSLETLALEEGAERYSALVLDAEMFDDGLLGKRVLPATRHAHARLLEAGAKVLPRSAKLRGAVIEMRVVPNPRDVSDLDFSSLGDRHCWAASHESIHLSSSSSDSSSSSAKGLAWKALSEAFNVWEFELESREAMMATPTHDLKSTALTLVAAGRGNAVMTWHELDLGDGHAVISSHPSRDQQYWQPAVHWVQPFKAKAGDRVVITAARSDTATTSIVLAPKPTRVIGVEPPAAEWCETKVHVRTWELLGNEAIVAACRDAIGHAVRTMQSLRRHPSAGGVHVLELQCGPTRGLLSMLAVRAGARSVLATDTSVALVESCRELAHLNGMGHGQQTQTQQHLLRFTGKHPSKITAGGGESDDLARPADVLLLPMLPELGLLEGGLLQVIKAVQGNAALLTRDAAVVPSTINVWAQLVELTAAIDLGGGRVMDCSAPLSLTSPAQLSSPPAIDLSRTAHRALSAPIEVTNVRLAFLVNHSTREPRSAFEVRDVLVPITAAGNATAVVWWWSTALWHGERRSITVGNAPGGRAPWLQDAQVLVDAPRFEAGELASLSMFTRDQDRGLSFRVKVVSPESSCKSSAAALLPLPPLPPPPLVDPHWAAAWARVTGHQAQIHEAVSQDPKLLQEVTQVAEAIAIDPASVRAAMMDGVSIDHRDAAALAAAYRY